MVRGRGQTTKNPKGLANWIMGDMAAQMKEQEKELKDLKFDQKKLCELVDLIVSVFFYGQSYLGALEPYLNAVLFRLFGFSPNLIFVLPTLFSTALIWLVYKFAGCFYGPDVAISAAAVVAVAPVDMLQRTLSAAGGFALAALLELVAVWLFIRLYAADRPRLRVAFVFSAVSGLACWVWQIYVPGICSAGSDSNSTRDPYSQSPPRCNAWACPCRGPGVPDRFKPIMGLQLAPFGVDIPCRLCQIHGRREQRELRGSRGALQVGGQTFGPSGTWWRIAIRLGWFLFLAGAIALAGATLALSLTRGGRGLQAIPRPRKRRAFLSLIAVALLLAWGLRDFVRGVGVWIAGQAAYVAAKTEGNRVFLLCIVCAVLCVAIGIAAQISILVRKGDAHTAGSGNSTCPWACFGASSS